jgi:hypothetical protein
MAWQSQAASPSPTASLLPGERGADRRECRRQPERRERQGEQRCRHRAGVNVLHRALPQVGEGRVHRREDAMGGRFGAHPEAAPFQKRGELRVLGRFAGDALVSAHGVEHPAPDQEEPAPRQAGGRSGPIRARKRRGQEQRGHSHRVGHRHPEIAGPGPRKQRQRVERERLGATDRLAEHGRIVDRVRVHGQQPVAARPGGGLHQGVLFPHPAAPRRLHPGHDAQPRVGSGERGE